MATVSNLQSLDNPRLCCFDFKNALRGPERFKEDIFQHEGEEKGSPIRCASSQEQRYEQFNEAKYS